MSSWRRSSNGSRKTQPRTAAKGSTISASRGQGRGAARVGHSHKRGGPPEWPAFSTTTTPFSQRAEPSPLWSKASPKRRDASDGGPGGNFPAVGGSKGPEPLASPNVIHWVGWLPLTTRCGTGPAVPASQPEARLDSLPPLAGNATACGVPIPDGEVPSQPPPPPLPGCGTNSMVSSRDRMSQGPGSGQVTDYSDTYG